MSRILIADDERTARNSFKAVFEGEGYSVLLAKDGAEAVRLFTENSPDLVLLDVMMPKMNGLAACAEIRRLDAVTPILFFTAMPSDVSLVRGLGLGADDYIDKARSPEEFVARVRAALRRKEAIEASARAGDVVVLGSVTVDLRKMTIDDGMGGIVSLTKSETLLLDAFNRARGKYLGNDELFSIIHGEDYSGDVNKVRSFVSTLKKKLGRAGDLIVNSYRSGYSLIK